MILLAAAVYCWTAIATPVSVHDGDTFTADVRIWPHLTKREKIRVQGVDTPELKKATMEKAVAARDYVIEWIGTTDVLIYTCGTYTFERLVARVMRLRDGAVLAEDLIKAGHAVPLNP